MKRFWFLLLFPIQLLSQTITVISPNGGEQWVVGSVQTIRWAATGTFTDDFNIQYSVGTKDAAGNLLWTSIGNVSNKATSYVWTIPNIPSSLCLVRIRHYNSTKTPKDQSNAVFTIRIGDNPPPPTGQPDSLILIAPNGGEKWQRGSQQQITWEKFGAVQNVKLEYSLDFGSTWKLIVASTANDGVHTWAVADTTWPMAVVRVSDVDGFPRDQSNSLFAITRKSRTGNILLIWNKNTETDLAGYRIWYSNTSGNYALFIGVPTSLADTVSYELKNLQPNIYYFSVSAFDINGNESGLSNEVSAIIEDWPPDIEIPNKPLILRPEVKY